MGYTNITSRVSLLRELSSEEFVEFGAEDTVGHELALLADLSGHFGFLDNIYINHSANDIWA